MHSGGCTCPCCGWSGLSVRPYERIEFGNDDNPGTTIGVSFERYCSEWIHHDTPWFDRTAQPHDWSLDRRLAAAGIDVVRRELPLRGMLSGEGLADELVRKCPEVQGTINDHLADYDGELLLHLLVTDVRRFEFAAFEESNEGQM